MATAHWTSRASSGVTATCTYRTTSAPCGMVAAAARTRGPRQIFRCIHSSVTRRIPCAEGAARMVPAPIEDRGWEACGRSRRGIRQDGAEGVPPPDVVCRAGDRGAMPVTSVAILTPVSRRIRFRRFRHPSKDQISRYVPAMVPPQTPPHSAHPMALVPPIEIGRREPPQYGQPHPHP